MTGDWDLWTVLYQWCTHSVMTTGPLALARIAHCSVAANLVHARLSVFRPNPDWDLQLCLWNRSWIISYTITTTCPPCLAERKSLSTLTSPIISHWPENRCESGSWCTTTTPVTSTSSPSGRISAHSFPRCHRSSRKTTMSALWSATAAFWLARAAAIRSISLTLSSVATLRQLRFSRRTLDEGPTWQPLTPASWKNTTTICWRYRTGTTSFWVWRSWTPPSCGYQHFSSIPRQQSPGRWWISSWSIEVSWRSGWPGPETSCSTLTSKTHLIHKPSSLSSLSS